MASTPFILPQGQTQPKVMKHTSISDDTLTGVDALLTAWLNNASNKYFGIIGTPQLTWNEEAGQLVYKIYYVDYTPIDTPVTRGQLNTTISSPPDLQMRDVS